MSDVTSPAAPASNGQAPESGGQDAAQPLRSVYTTSLPAVLDHFGISLVVSTYQAVSGSGLAGVAPETFVGREPQEQLAASLHPGHGLGHGSP